MSERRVVTLACRFSVALALGFAPGASAGTGLVATTLDAAPSDSALAVVATADGGIVVLGQRGKDALPALVAYTAAGAVDPRFGSNGRVLRVPGLETAGALLRRPDGRLLVVGARGSRLGVAGLLPDGRTDGSYGNGGLAIVPEASGAYDELGGAALAADGSLLVVAGLGGDRALRVARLTPAGVADPAFGSGGVAQFAKLCPEQCNPITVASLPDGRVLVTEGIASDSQMVAFTPAGVADATFGRNGVVKLPAFASDIMPFGGRVAALLHKHPDIFPAVVGYDLHGHPDATWGTNGLTPVSTAIRTVGALGGALSLVAEGANVLALISEGAQLNVTRLDAQGRPDPVLGGSDGATTRVPQPAPLYLEPSAGAVRRADGSLIFVGAAGAGGERSPSDWLLAALGGPRFALLPSFGPAHRVRVTLHAGRQSRARVGRRGLRVTVRVTHRGVVALTATPGRSQPVRRVVDRPGVRYHFDIPVRLGTASRVRVRAVASDLTATRSAPAEVTIRLRR